MLLLKGLIRSFCLFLLVCFAIIIVVLAPKELIAQPTGPMGSVIKFQYDFSFTLYKENIVQFLTYAWEHKSLGFSEIYNISVEEEIGKYLPRSLMIIAPSFILSILLGVLKGIYDYRSKRKFLGKGLTSLFLSIPDFFLILCFQWIVLFYFPIIQLFGHDNWYSFILPTFLVSIYPVVYVAKITSTSITGQQGQQYIQVAKSKGLPDLFVLYKHTLKNCWATILSYFPTIMLYILANLLIVEYLVGL